MKTFPNQDVSEMKAMYLECAKAQLIAARLALRRKNAPKAKKHLAEWRMLMQKTK